MSNDANVSKREILINKIIYHIKQVIYFIIILQFSHKIVYQ